ncbi:hypothetical protein Ancab_033579 [Ancistrocladus abbreviatus]
MAADLVLFLLLFPITLLLRLVSSLSGDPFCTLTSSDSLCTYCQNSTRNYTLNSPFSLNLRSLLQSLPANAYLTGFHNGSVGENPNEAYAQVLCRRDISPTECKVCLQTASQEILRECQTKEAIIWFETCQVHYSDSLFFESMVYTGKFPPYNDGEKNVTDPTKTEAVLKDLFGKLSDQAAYDTSRKMFAVGRAELAGSQIYGLVQCTRDISAGDCYSCLCDAFGDLEGCCSSHQGGIVLSRNCGVRFENFRFYNLSAVDGEISLEASGKRIKIWLAAVIAVILSILSVVLAGTCFFCWRRKKKRRNDEKRSLSVQMSAFAMPQTVSLTEDGELVTTEELHFMDLSSIKAATDNFSDANKLGEGGFGAVYEGTLPDGTKIAAKRLLRRSWQGIEAFKNEIILIAKLQHRNLVRLLGCSIEEQEKILVYEFMPNKSLDFFIDDVQLRTQLNWDTRYSIICGIARGLLYLHEESRLTIIHRDLKPNNVLLDHDMVAKISDFGMARIFSANQNAASTKRIVGTFGYMSPEYAMEGLFSVKSDVFSFGVILLEIISGKRSIGFFLTEHAQTLLAYAWRLWKGGKELEFVDSLMPEPYPTSEVLRCMHIGLLCVQEDPSDRPTMSYVVSVLSSEATALPGPNSPAISVGRHVTYD